MAYQTAEIQHEERPLEIRNACEYIVLKTSGIIAAVLTMFLI